MHRYIDDLAAEDAVMVALAQQGLAALRNGDYTTVDTPETSRSFWGAVEIDATARRDDLRDAASGDNESRQQPAPEPRE